jgi:hypothetical protein
MGECGGGGSRPDSHLPIYYRLAHIHHQAPVPMIRNNLKIFKVHRLKYDFSQQFFCQTISEYFIALRSNVVTQIIFNINKKEQIQKYKNKNCPNDFFIGKKYPKYSHVRSMIADDLRFYLKTQKVLPPQSMD